MSAEHELRITAPDIDRCQRSGRAGPIEMALLMIAADVKRRSGASVYVRLDFPRDEYGGILLRCRRGPLMRLRWWLSAYVAFLREDI